MYKGIIFTLLCFINAYLLPAQILPQEGCALNYRLIGFSFPIEKNYSSYILELAKGTCNSEDSFKENIVKTLNCSRNKIIAETPFWGQTYTWRIKYIGKDAQSMVSPFHHFSILFNSTADTSIVRLRIIQVAKKYKEAFVFVDNNKAMYDMDGKPVWFLPDKIVGNAVPRDLKLSSRGTITFLVNDNAYEIDFNGDILWQGPNTGVVSGGSRELYHHELTRVSNGHYMVMGDEVASLEPDTEPGGSGFNRAPAEHIKYHLNKMPSPSRFGTIIEYDEKGNVVWAWKSSGYFLNSDIIYNKNHHLDTHANSFFFDEKAKVVYISFKNISRIIKVKYPEGNVLNVYGEIFKPDIDEKGNGLFCDQHSIKHSESGYMYLYNNNNCDTVSFPKVTLLQEPTKANAELKKIWEYECTPDSDYAKKNYLMKDIKGGGGNVMELPDHSLFVCMGALSYCKLFIVDRAKEILWSAIPEKYFPSEQKWIIVPQYRASIFEGEKNIEKLIWNAEKN
jgi:hypothetical protein